jgi:hypothetical protein
MQIVRKERLNLRFGRSSKTTDGLFVVEHVNPAPVRKTLNAKSR